MVARNLSREKNFLFLILFLGGLGWTLYLCLHSPGVPKHDEISHYLTSRSAWQSPVYLLNLWGRPFRTLLYMVPSLGGLMGARLASMAMAGLTVLVSVCLARNLGVKRAFLLPALLWFQPMFNHLSYTVLPQVPFSLLLVSALFFWSEKRYCWASLAFGLLPLTRHEGIALTLLWIIYMLYRRNWRCLMLAIGPLVAFNAAYYAVLGRPAFSIYLSLKPTTRYGSGGWLHYALPLPKNAGLVTLLLAGAGIIPLVKRGRDYALLAFHPAYFLVHTIVYRFGLFASGGYQVFMLPMAPFLAILGALGLEYVVSFSEKSTRLRRRPLAAKYIQVFLITAALAAVIFTGLQTRPRPLDSEATIMKETARWIKEADLDYPAIYSTHVWFFYFSKMLYEPGADVSSHPPLRDMPEDTIVVWDRHFSERWQFSYDKLSEPGGGWQRLASFGNGFAVVFQKGPQGTR